MINKMDKELIKKARRCMNKLDDDGGAILMEYLCDALEKAEQENAQLRAMWQLYGAVMKEASEPPTEEEK